MHTIMCGMCIMNMLEIPINLTSLGLPFYKRAVFKFLIRVIHPTLLRWQQLKSPEKWHVTSPAQDSW